MPALHGHGAGSRLGVKMDRPRPEWSKAPQAREVTDDHAMSQTVCCGKSQPEQWLLRGEVLFELSLGCGAIKKTGRQKILAVLKKYLLFRVEYLAL